MAEEVLVTGYNTIQQTQETKNPRFIINNRHLVAVAIHLIIFTKSHVLSTTLLIHNQPPLSYIRYGDLNIGGIISGLAYSSDSACGSSLFMNASFHFSEAIAFAVDEINNNNSLLPDITLGFVILDDCMKESTAAVQAISFLKQSSHISRREESATPDNETCLLFSNEVETEGDDRLPTYDVVGVIGCLRSSSSAAAAMILGSAQVPMVSFASTSEILSNRELYPYFMRVVSSDNSLVNVQMVLIHDFGWRYISVVYDEGDFGEMAFQALRKELSKSEDKICIATSHKIYRTSTYDDYLEIIKDLMQHRNARVVIVYTDPPSSLELLKAISELGATGWFIWLVSDSWKTALGQTTDESILRSAAGCLVSAFASEVSAPYNNYLLQMDPSNNTNPWFARFWADTFKCPLTDPACVSANKVSSLPGLTTFPYANNAYDAVLTYAHGIQNVIDTKCPNKTGSDVRDCITGPDLLQSMRSLSFQGPTGQVEFDHLGSALGKFHVEQIIPSDDYRGFNITPVAFFYTSNSKMKYIRNITFDYVNQEGFLDVVPVSVCSKPCGPGQFVIPKDQVCCWECRTCRNNEILVNDFTDCFICPLYEWPDPQTNFTICEPIPPHYPQFNTPIVIMCLVLAGLGALGVALVALAHYRYRSLPIIKASGRELTTVQLVSTLIGYLTVPIFTIKPSIDACFASFFMYCLSFTGLYAPLLVKSIRIHRIFTVGKKSNAKMKFISPRSQILFTVLLVSVQMFLCIISAIVYQPLPVLTQLVRTENYVELSCDWTLPGHISFLVYNIVLVLLCSVFAFKTRKLPDNFNESKFINLCVYSSLIIRFALIPVYFTTERQNIKTLLLALSILVNHTVVMIFLFLPKIYASVNLIPTTAISSCSVENSTRRGSVVSATHNNRFLYGLSEVLSALRTASPGKPELGQEPCGGSLEHLRSTLPVPPKRDSKHDLNKVSPVENQQENEAVQSSSIA